MAGLSVTQPRSARLPTLRSTGALLHAQSVVRFGMDRQSYQTSCMVQLVLVCIVMNIPSNSQTRREMICEKRCRNDIDAAKMSISAPLMPLFQQNCGSVV